MLICEKRKGTAGYDTVRGKKERDQKLENCEVEKRSGTSNRAVQFCLKSMASLAIA